MWCQEQEKADKESEETAHQRTFRFMREEADNIIPGLAFTTDRPSDNKDGRCPMLDLKVWAESVDGICNIRHKFYKKEISAPLVFHARASHS